ncbi:hypothetical protein IGI04_033143 [Brassica rapa subsp. trilocularis]|uniref:Uncharacterized protein n=1 Tax=Brassica rapa subsp. trilocularis TaxID=1813537 RepID=A0ABQ7L8E4_BRACM|nr:hypothetical protein IGI04_033143 [Brassica rapa subsp. trilocularis]
MGVSVMGGVRWDLRISERVRRRVEAKGGKRWGERGEEGSGGSGGNGGGRRTSPEVEDDGCTAETRPGRAQRFCIGKRVRESLTFFTFNFCLLPENLSLRDVRPSSIHTNDV